MSAVLKMKYLLILLVQLIANFAYGRVRLRYRSKEAQYMIGAIIPLTQEDSNGNCTRINPQGITIAEAIVYALDNINTEDEFKELLKKKSIGYDIRDNCGKPSETDYHVFNMGHETVLFNRGKTSEMPVKIVISEFTLTSLKNLPVLNSHNIIQMSYSKDNARLKRDSTVSSYVIKQLISIYPVSTKKISAIVDILKAFQFNHVYAVATNNVQGNNTLKLLSKELRKYKICKSKDLFASSVADVNSVLDTIAVNRKIRVVVVHCTKDVELGLYKEAKNRNMTDLIFITTQNWYWDIKSLKPYASVVEGMIYFEYIKNEKYFQTYLQSRNLPYRNRKWLQKLFLGIGGSNLCLKDSLQPNKNCTENEKKVSNLLVKNEPAALYAFEAVYGIAYALKKSVKNKIPFLEATKGLHVEIPAMALNSIVFNNELSVETSKYKIYSIRGNEPSKVINKWLGQWDANTETDDALLIRKKEIQWKDGKKETPLSACSDTCAPGYERSFLNVNRKCCWTCSECPNNTASNISNSDKCLTCPKGHVVRPDKAGCIKYKLIYFKWFGPVGWLIIILMVIGIVFILFALGIFSQNNMHELVLNANYNSLLFFLLACVILIFTPIPLLVQPTLSTCLSYIVLLNVSVSMILAVLLSRSAYVNGLFDENGQLVKGTLGRYPRLVVALIVVILQFVVTIVAYKMETLYTMHSETNHWAERYHECSSWASITFWAGFCYNVVVSIIGNCMSCTSTKIEDNAYELKYILLSHLMLYMFDLVLLCIFFRSTDEHLAGGQGITCIIFAYSFYICYIAPKIYVILFRSRGNKAIEEPLVNHGEDDDMMTTAIHASAGFKHQGIVQMKVRDED